jgi:hypothetical protein
VTTPVDAAKARLEGARSNSVYSGEAMMATKIGDEILVKHSLGFHACLVGRGADQLDYRDGGR